MFNRLSILFGYAWRYKWSYLVGLIALLGTDIFMLIRPRIVGKTIDSLELHEPRSTIMILVGLFMLYVITENAFRFLWRFTLIGASRRVERDIQNDFFGKLLRLDSRFFDRMPTGDLMARATNDVGSIRMLMGPGVMAMVDAVIVFIITIILMLRIDAQLTLLALAPIPVLGILIGYLLRQIHVLYDKVQEQFSTISARAQESLSGIRVVKAHNREQHEINEFKGVVSDYVSKFMDLTKYESALEPVIRLVAGLGIVITLYIGGQHVMDGRMTIGNLVEFFLYFMIITWPVIAIGWSANLYERGMASLKRLQEILDEKPTILSDDFNLGDAAPAASASGDGAFRPGDIEFRGVSYRYLPEGPDALKDVNLVIPMGATIGIVGPTGAGKTTLLNLIARLYDPTQGEVLIGGRNIREFPVVELRRHIGVVPQEPFLFSLNIRDNLNLGRRTNPLAEEHVVEALDMADVLQDVKEFPRQFETVLGERGVRLSGGQKQRMTIARALARKNDIVLLDDTLSSVDTQTEERVIQNLRSFGEGRTNIIVSHRISAVKDADMIVVLDEDGRVVERGRHEDLLMTGGFYARLYRQQMLEQKIQHLDNAN